MATCALKSKFNKPKSSRLLIFPATAADASDASALTASASAAAASATAAAVANEDLIRVDRCCWASTRMIISALRLIYDAMASGHNELRWCLP